MDSPEGVNSFGYCSGCPGCDIRKPGGPDCAKHGGAGKTIDEVRESAGQEPITDSLYSLPEGVNLFDAYDYQ